MGKEPNDPQPGPSGLQTPVMVEDDEMAGDHPLSFSACPTNPKPATHPPSIQASPAALHLKVRRNVCLVKFFHDKVQNGPFTYAFPYI
jgi:hypothetical protein